MRNSIVIFLAILLGLPVLAQYEVQSDLTHNPTYWLNPHLKGLQEEEMTRDNVSNFELCEIGYFLETVSSFVEPDCDSSNGSISLIVNSSEEEFDYYLNDVLVESGAGNTMTFDGLASGAYRIRIESTNNQECELFIVLSNAGVDPIPPEIFEISAAFCGQGRIKKSLIIEIEVTNYTVFDAEGNLAGSLTQFTPNLNLVPGNYYVQKEGIATNCVAYFAFEIEQAVSAPLPFIDDFSNSNIFPNSANWADQQAFVNRSFAIDPLSIGVATLDGINEFGFPYQVADDFVAGSADSLTSQPFCVDDFEDADSLYFSFLFQPQGISDFPNADDSLFVDFKDDEGMWHQMWSIGGEELFEGMELQNDTFYQVTIPVVDDTLLLTNDETFFFDGFQFRFRNIASITGLNDPWHIDYVRLEPNATFSSLTIQNEFAFVYNPLPLLKNYSAMPWHQFYDYQEDEFVDSLRFTFRSTSNASNADAEFLYAIYELCDSIEIETNQGQQALNVVGPTNQTNNISIPLLGNTFEDLSENKEETDNIIVHTDYVFLTDNDFNKSNDTVSTDQIFSNYYAYDDGTAEKAYGVLGQGAQIAVEFKVNQPDFLKGIQIYFTHIVGDVSNNTFAIKAWQNIDNQTNGDVATNDVLIGSRGDLVPLYTGEVGGFTTYTFDEPIPIDSTFYVGLEQDFVDILNIGQDVNYLEYDTTYQFGVDSNAVFVDEFKHTYAGDKTFINANGVWLESIIPGAVMIRALVGPQNPVGTNVDELAIKEPNLTIYPNPANDVLHLNLNQYMPDVQIQLYDFAGRLLANYPANTNLVDVNQLSAGMYMLRLLDEKGQTLTTEKFVKH